MALAHLTVAGDRRVRADRGRHRVPPAGEPARCCASTAARRHPKRAALGPRRRLGRRWALIGLGAMIVLTPLGLIAIGHRVRRGRERDAASGTTRCSTGTASARIRSSATSLSAAVGAIAARDHRARYACRGRTRPAPCRRGRSMTTATATPQWLVQPEVGLCPCGCIGKRRKGSFVEKTLGGAAGLLRQAMFSEDIASRSGLLQRVDPRVKLLSLFGLLVVDRVRAQRSRCSSVMYARDARARGRVEAVAVVLRQARVAVHPDLHRHRRAARDAERDHARATSSCRSARGSATELGLTAQGLTSAGADRHPGRDVDLAGRAAHAHDAVGEAARRRCARSSCRACSSSCWGWRTATCSTSSARSPTCTPRARRARWRATHDVTSGRAFVAASAGALFGKAHALSEEVHMAMVARGLSRATRAAPTTFSVRVFDVAFVASCAAAAVLTLGLDRVVTR